MAGGGDQVDGVDQVVAHGFGDEVVEVDADPAGFDAFPAARDLGAELQGPRVADAEQPVAVRPGARAAAARLHAEQVVEHGDDIVVVEELLAVPDAQRHDRQPPRVAVAEDVDGGVAGPALQRAAPQPFLPGLDDVGADGLLQAEHQARSDRLDDGRGAAFLPGHRVVQVPVARGVHEQHGAAARRGRYAASHQVAPHHQHAGGLRAADELVRGQEDRVLVVAQARRARPHADRHVRPGRRVVPERQGPVLVQERGHRVGVGQDAGHVGRGGETADQRPARVPFQPGAQRGQVDLATPVLADDDGLGDALPPRQLVGVVLVRADEHHRPIAYGDAVQQAVPAREPVGEAQFQDADELVDGRGRAGPAEDHQVAGAAADGLVHGLPGLFA